MAGEVDEAPGHHLHHRDVRHDARAGEVPEVDHGLALGPGLGPQPRDVHQLVLRQVAEEVEHLLGPRVHGGVHRHEGHGGGRAVGDGHAVR